MQQKWSFPDQVERWDVFEARVSGPKEGNPFAEQWIRGVFTGAQESVQADGFYDGDGQYAVSEYDLFARHQILGNTGKRDWHFLKINGIVVPFGELP